MMGDPDFLKGKTKILRLQGGKWNTLLTEVLTAALTFAEKGFSTERGRGRSPSGKSESRNLTWSKVVSPFDQEKTGSPGAGGKLVGEKRGSLEEDVALRILPGRTTRAYLVMGKRSPGSGD